MSAPISRRPVEILLVEDSRDDADLMTAALVEGGLWPSIRWVEDGEDAVRYLRRLEPFETASPPDLILLDLHLPRKNGFEVLADIKSDPQLCLIPVVILTSSDDERAFLTAYDLRANCCVAKPADQEQFARTVSLIETFWLAVARRPRLAPDV